MTREEVETASKNAGLFRPNMLFLQAKAYFPGLLFSLSSAWRHHLCLRRTEVLLFCLHYFWERPSILSQRIQACPSELPLLRDPFFGSAWRPWVHALRSSRSLAWAGERSLESASRFF